MKKWLIGSNLLTLLLAGFVTYLYANQPVPQNTTLSYVYPGQKGEPGSMGAVGFTGLQGAQGLRGATGAQGLKGEVGPQGEKGDVGVQGEPGQDAEPIAYEWRCHPTQNVRQYRAVGDSVWKNETNSSCRV